MPRCSSACRPNASRRATPLRDPGAERFRVGHATEAINEILRRHRVAALRQRVRLGLADDRLAVDQHPITVENYQIEAAGGHLHHSTGQDLVCERYIGNSASTRLPAPISHCRSAVTAGAALLVSGE
jgi:hypothetical protein